MGLCQKGITEPENLIQAARLRKDFRMGGYADYTAQYLRSHTISGVAVNYSVKPIPAQFMVGGIGPEGVNEYIEVG